MGTVPSHCPSHAHPPREPLSPATEAGLFVALMFITASKHGAGMMQSSSPGGQYTIPVVMQPRVSNALLVFVVITFLFAVGYKPPPPPPPHHPP